MVHTMESSKRYHPYSLSHLLLRNQHKHGDVSSNDSSASGRKNQLEDLTSENIAQITDADALFGAPSTLDMCECWKWIAAVPHTYFDSPAMHRTIYYPKTQSQQCLTTSPYPSNNNTWAHPVDIPRHDLPLHPSACEQVSSAAITDSSDSASGRTFQPPPLPIQTFNAPTDLPATETVRSSMNPMNTSLFPFERYRDPDNPSRIKLPTPWSSSSRHGAPMNSTRYHHTNITGHLPSPVRLAPPGQTIPRMALSPPPQALIHFPDTSNSVILGPLPLNTAYSTSASLTPSNSPVISEQQPRFTHMPHIQNSTAQGLVEVDHTTGSRPQPGYSDGLSLSGNRRDGTANPRELISSPKY
ncbi:hypothetical protein AN958_04026 [Leucoagaricus sp. SymC.cos]|nr:hypothetical protein AN958_04026 [Leucoagaricus sp. SymC.cos]